MMRMGERSTMNFFYRVMRFIRNPMPAIRRRADIVRHRIAVNRGNRKTSLDNESIQFCSPENDESFDEMKTDIKAIALYLPQFHEFEENNKWWGKGFTEWTNVKKNIPRFEGHNQPRVPHDDIGYYDLSTEEAVRQQVELAKRHGIHAFGMYYYWFSGHRLMEKPMDILLNNKDMDISFFAIWANENFTRAWDGQERDVLLGQEYSDDDPEMFIGSLKKYIDDERYLRVDGKPVVGLYNPGFIPEASDVLSAWRDCARKLGIGEILIWVCVNENRHCQAAYYPNVDGEYEFPPRGKAYVEVEYTPNEGTVYDYLGLVESARHFPVEPFDTLVPCYRGTMMEWDNSARRNAKYTAWKNYSPFRFYVWNRIAVGYLRSNFDAEHRYLFINAWNEWGEGTYLEPDKKYGYANINSLSRAIFDLPYGHEHPELVEYLGAYREPEATSAKLASIPRVAVQAHMFYADLADELSGYLGHIPCPFDLFVTTDSREKAEAIRSRFSAIRNVSKLEVSCVDNRGRDVLPFLEQMSNVIDEYDLVCHIHTKKSVYGEYGADWRTYLLQNLLGSENLVLDIFNAFLTNEKLGVVFPQTFHAVKNNLEWGSNRQIALRAIGSLGMQVDLPMEIVFPAGNMLWFRPKSVRQLFSPDVPTFHSEGDDEKIDGTIMHAVERLWPYVAESNGFETMVTRNVLDDFELAELRENLYRDGHYGKREPAEL